MQKIYNLLLILLVLISACNKDDEGSIPTTGFVEGNISDMLSDNAIAGVRILIYDANTNSPLGNTWESGTDGRFSIQLDPGNYYMKLYKQGYENVPQKGFSTVPFTIVAGETFNTDYQMDPSSITDGGWISGKITNGNQAIAGVLVVATNGSDAYSSVSDSDGNYYIYNIPAGNYEIKGWKAGYESEASGANVTADQELSDVAIKMTEGASGGVSGQITFLATTNVQIDVSLTHPVSRETIPGLSTKTVSENYLISDVPAGSYLAVATFENDTKVMDPDWIIRNGEPFIDVIDGTFALDFSVTGAITLDGPTNEVVSSSPVEISSTQPTFSWIEYPSVSDYVIEVTDANGNLVWGGFSDHWAVKNVTVPKSQKSATYNFDGSASISALKPGKIYRWRVYASKDDAKEPNGWKLISVSEDQQGLIKIAAE